MKHITTLVSLLITFISAPAQNFAIHFADSTLRLDYIFAGDSNGQQIYLDQLSMTNRWYGRRHRLGELPLKGNGNITVRDKNSGKVLYRHSFSTLFQEWLATEEARHTPRSFENVFLIPYPRQVVKVKVELYDYHGRVMAQMEHEVDPNDVLIAHHTRRMPYVTLQQATDTAHCIHIAYVAEGYTEAQMQQYLDDCHAANEALFSHEPFRTLWNRFNIIALLSPSKDSDVSQPGKKIWLDTALSSHFNTFYVERYLTAPRLKKLHDLLNGTPYEHIIVLVNTKHYGGGGIYNSYNLSYTRGEYFLPVVVHEFGHSFGGLGDEYPYGDSDPMYFEDTEPWEPNLTTHTSHPVKWQNLIDAGKASLVEGGGYLSKGVWRGQDDCRMRSNKHPEFCPVCQQSLQRLIDFYTR